MRLLRSLPALLLALIMLWQMPRVWAGLQKTHSFQPGHLTAAQFLRDRHATPGDVVMTRFPAIVFHANISWAATPNAPWPEVVAYAQRRVACYLVFDAWEAELRPQLRFLLEPSATPPELRYLTTLDAGAGK